MKKKLTMFGVLVVSFLFCVAGVKAMPIIEYPNFGNGSKIYIKNLGPGTIDFCFIEDDIDECDEYIVSDDDGIDDSNFILTKVSDPSIVITTDKSYIPTTIIVESHKKKVNVKDLSDFFKDVPSVYQYEEYSDSSDITKVKYYNIYDNKSLKNILSEISETSEYYVVKVPFDHLYVRSGDFDEITVPKNVTLVADGLATNNLVVNGDVIIPSLTASNISGSGTISLDYKANIFRAVGSDNEIYKYATRLFFEQLSGVKIDIINMDIKEGLPLGAFDDVSEENSKKRVAMLNKSLGTSLDGYEVVLDSTTVENEPYLYGKLSKFISNTTTVANPKTSDSIFNIVTIMALVGAITFVTVKKIKNN